MPQPHAYLVTGAGRDIGRGIAEILATAGSFAVLHYSNSKEGAEETLNAIRAKGADGVLVHADFTKIETVVSFCEEVTTALRGYKLNTLVHNAAFTTSSAAGHLDSTALHDTLKANVLFPYLLTDALSPVLADSGSIIALSVGATQKVFSPDFGFFCASKAAIDTLVRNWAVQFAPRKIRANAIAPGVVEVNFRAGLLKDPAFRQNLESMTTLARPGTVSDIAQIAQFLASEQSGWITGQVIDSSGGWKL